MIHIMRAGFIGFFTGLCASIPLGPAGLESINRSVSKGFWHGFKVSLGAVFADYTYLIIINLGLFNILEDNKTYKGVFWIVSGIVLFLFAKHSKNSTGSSKILNNPKLGEFISGFIITFINPVTFSFWLAFSGTVASIWRSDGRLFFYTSFLFMLIGSLTWFTILNILASKGLKLLKKDIDKTASMLLTYVLYVIGVCFMAYGVYVLIC
ncbi:LysE family translocator [Clostridium sardiniense]|uniref:LysE family translocator n=1 Tax=Clostridium sardiniense TaxID=29369 RepID=UPI00195D0867|nr:LysE family transporter [Clostridium sardiniense]MBM7836403.1 threonine/homoserine/homoserine lactone efflux protein [Clostridium sardiniense]